PLSAQHLHRAQILLLRHDAAAGGELRADGKEAELGGGEEQDVLRQFGEVEHDLTERLHDRRFKLATRVLGVEHVALWSAEAEEVRHVAPVDRKRYAIAGGRAEGTLVVQVERRVEELQVIEQRFEIGPGPDPN